MNELEQRQDLAACYRLMAHIGVEDKMIFQPPFGYYDAESGR